MCGSTFPLLAPVGIPVKDEISFTVLKEESSANSKIPAIYCFSGLNV